MLMPDGSLAPVRRAEVLGPVAQLSKGDARTMLDARVRPINQGRHVPQSTLTLAEFYRREWEPTMSSLLKATSLHYYGIQYRCHIIPSLGDRRLCDLRRGEVQAFLAAKRKAGLSGSTVHGIRTALSKLMQSAVEWDFIPANPARGLVVGDRHPLKERVRLSPEQVRILSASLPDPCRSIVLLLCLTGLRIGELLALRTKNVDLMVGVIRVRETVHEGQFGAPKTRSSRREVPVSESARKLLKPFLAAGDETLVFRSRTGSPINPKNLSRRVLQPKCRELNLPVVSWHSFRHTHATLLTEVGESIKTTQAILGHSDLNTTLNIYSHPIPESQRRAIERVAEILVDPNGLTSTDSTNTQRIN